MIVCLAATLSLSADWLLEEFPFAPEPKTSQVWTTNNRTYAFTNLLTILSVCFVTSNGHL